MDTTVLTYRFAPEALPFREVVCYVLKLIQDRLEVVFEENESGQLCFGNGDNEYPLMQSIYEPLSRLKPCEEKYLSGIYIFYEGKMDILASIFLSYIASANPFPAIRRINMAESFSSKQIWQPTWTV